ncbi:tensin-3 isoform X2 [Denticeps clupeoides]|uniref:tensin-3 isoform X2 n=1 Tax=Denticeps clupeoides TaxID=299321 RepID=UPI0010A37D37|nr:tensin-3 isoform X2 [Denticeps clupeoides]
MEEGYELDLTYITERIIAVSFPRMASEETYLRNLKDVTRMLKSKHSDNYLTLDTGWPDLHAPPLDKICTICKAMESWLNEDPLHVVVIHCRGGKGRIGVVISSFVHFTDISASADQALDRFAMRKFYDDKVSTLMTPSQKRYVWILNSLLSGSMKINASPLFLHCVIMHGIPNFQSGGVCCPYLKVYQGMQAIYCSGVYQIGPGHRNRVCIALEPAQILKGDIMVKCYHKSSATSRDVIFRLQFHTGAVQGYNLIFEKEDMENANKDPRFPDYGKVELIFSEGPEKIQGPERWHNGPNVTVDYSMTEQLTRWDSYQNICDGEVAQSLGSSPDKPVGSRTLRRVGETLATSSPEHSDHALSASSDSGLSSTSLWTEHCTAPPPRPQGPSQQEKADLKRLLSGFGLDENPSSPSGRMSEQVSGPASRDQSLLHPARINGESQPKERETDILDDEVLLMSGVDLRSADSLGTLSSSCHKSSQNSLLSDSFCSPGVSEETSNAHQLLNHGPVAMEEYERAYLEARQGCLTQRTPSLQTASFTKAGPYLQESYSTHSWVRQQQMVAVHQCPYVPEPEPEHRYRGDQPDMSPPQDAVDRGSGRRGQEVTSEQMTIDKCRDEEFNSLTVDIDNSIDQLNQLIMELDPTFIPIPTHTSSVKRSNGTSTPRSDQSLHRLGTESSQGSSQQPAAVLAEVQPDKGHDLSRQTSDATDQPWGLREEFREKDIFSQRSIMFGSDAVKFGDQSTQLVGIVGTDFDAVPPTPAFPISPPTPYVKTDFSHFRQTTLPSMPLLEDYKTAHDCRTSTSHSSEEVVLEQSPVRHRAFGPTRSATIGGTWSRTESPVQSSWQEGAVLCRQASLPSQRFGFADHNHHSTAGHYLHTFPHPAPNSHSSPRSSQQSRAAQYALSRDAARSLDEPDGLSGDFPSHVPTGLLAGVEGVCAELRHRPLPQAPLLPEKRRASDGEHSLGSVSPALSGFSSPHSGSSLSIPFPHALPELHGRSAGAMPTTPSPLPDVLSSKQVTVKFVQDTSKYWYKPDISRDQAIAVLKDKEPGSFIVRDSHSFRGAYGLAMKVATPPPSIVQQSKKGGDLSNELVRHFLIECSQKGVRLKGCPNEPYFGSLTALVCQHSITPLALPCKLIIPDRDPLEDAVEPPSPSVTNSAAELLKQGAACNVWFLGSVDMESLTGTQAVQKATTDILAMEQLPTSTVVHFKVSSQGITLTDNQRKLFFRRHYAVNSVIYCALDPQDRKWKQEGCASARIFGFVARKTGSAMDNVCHLFAEHDPEQPASAIVNFVSKVMIGSLKNT